MDYSKTMDDVYNNNDYYSLDRKRKILLISDDMIGYIITNNKF